ncbi:acetyl-CoA hydrolase/transferase C-terminal domain-containing protein [Pseudonocardia halophobica]|uniref:4-hydroxybutyrate CoA-transferase n=1 Tax=Pseudonocardia halophobica TaxID=29401 RepID=A0A9W6KYR1_9PSEU|nr:acetyl-CoA hydrolase/transferase C-terminal domain-containing protein [Pseudonocardia halophobica]GLL09783.1 4-hydroxybutyrate CoA-transferase [Pseudonocardia halophobica]
MGSEESDEHTSRARELLEMVEDGALVVAAALGTQPRHLLRALGVRARSLSRVDLAAGMFFSDYAVLDAPSVRFRTWFPPGTAPGQEVPADRVEYLPMSWAQVVDWLAHRAEPDVLLVQLSPADTDGWHSFGVSSSYSAAAARAARLVIAEVNAQMPCTRGERIHASELAGVLHVDHPVPGYPRRPPAEVDAVIAEHVASLVTDARTLQAGVGSIPDAVYAQLAKEGRRDLRVHGSATSGLVDLHAAGCLANGPSLVGEVLGDQQLYDFVADNPNVEMVGGESTHAAAALLGVPNLTCINSALSVDVFGQVNTEYIGGRHVGAVGGAIDYSRAAVWPGNQGIVALRATAARGTVSRIVPNLDAATVSLPRDSTQFVVTEFGVADLRDKTVPERRRELARVAHPSFRSSLED